MSFSLQSGWGRRFMLALLVVIGVASLYTITYSGTLEIADQLQYYDAVGNLVRVGEPNLTLSMWQFMPESFPRPPRPVLRETIAEPGLILAAAPLYWLADQLDGMGLVHTTYLFNVVVCALVCAILFGYAVTLGYSERTALLGAVCFGIGTILLPYSQKFFREPLMMVWLMLAALMLEQARRKMWRGRLFGIGLAVLLLIAALYTKGAAILALPGLLIIASSDGVWKRRSIQRISDGLLLTAIIVTLVIAYTDVLKTLFPPDQAGRLRLFAQFAIEPEYTRTALHTYIFSLGGSIIGTSPLLLLALPGAWWLLKQGERRRVWGSVLVALGFAYGYALLRGEEWFGGTIWPQRFLLPTLPFMMLLVLPVLDRLIGAADAKNRVPTEIRIFVGTPNEVSTTGNVRTAESAQRPMLRPLWRGLFVLLMLYSLWWQLSAVSFDWNAYSAATYDLSFGGLVYWSPGFNEVQYLRPVVLSQLWGTQALTFAWARLQAVWIPLVFGVMFCLCLRFAWRILVPHPPYSTHPTLQASHRRGTYISVALLSFAYVALTFLMLRTIYIDPLYQGDNPALHEMMAHIRQSVPPDEPVILSEREYDEFFLNYGKIGARQVIALPFHPGDRASCEQPLRIESDNPEVLLAPYTAPVLHALAERSSRVWVLASSGPEIPCVVRPVERLMGERYYRVAETRTAPQVRLIQYHTTDAPDPYAFRGSDAPVDLTYTYSANDGNSNRERIALIGMTLPLGERYQAGDWLPLSLYWQTDNPLTQVYPLTRVYPLTQVYTVAWFVADASGVKAQGEDSWHGATFSPTTLWQPRRPIWDHRALRLPVDLPDGEYQLWVKVYWQDPVTGVISDLQVNGSTTLDAVIGVLPMRIQVAPPLSSR